MRFGCFEFHERIAKQVAAQGLEAPLLLTGTRLFPYARDLYGDRVITALPDGDLLCVNALATELPALDRTRSQVFTAGNRIVCALILSADRSALRQRESSLDFTGLPVQEIPQTLFPEHVFDLPLSNGRMIERDARYFAAFAAASVSAHAVHGPTDRLLISPNAVIEPFAAFNTEKGPIVIEDGVTITAFSRIEGPCHIGAGTGIYRANIREGCSFGPSCRAGGEVEDSIFAGFTNKYHDGFIGHAYVGSWVNLGAMTTNSDLRNDYGPVTMQLGSRKVDTGSNKAGAVIADFVKCSIGTLMNTGAVIGTGAMTVFSGRMTPPFIPPFSRFIKNELRDYPSVDAVLSTIGTQMARRNCNFPPSLGSLLRDIVLDSAGLREEVSDQWNRKRN